MGRVTVVIGWYGTVDPWRVLAERAAKSVPPPHPVHIAHGDTLHEARNLGLKYAQTEFVIFLDADDELSPDYVDVLMSGAADVRVPSVSYIQPSGVPSAPAVPKVFGHVHECEAPCLALGNYIVIGAMMRTEKVRAVGGFHDWPVYEDWDLFARMWQAGATFETISKAVYHEHSRVGSRNKSLGAGGRLKVHQEIAIANGLPVPI
jgi:glycosyltransferase involved in cell wall biosynthesis